MLKRNLLCLIIGVLFCSQQAFAEIVVIVNADSAIETLGKRQLIDLYMGKTPYFDNGELAVRLDQPSESGIREQFYQALVGKSAAAVNAYWAKLLFTGRASPPQVVSSSVDVLETVRSIHNAIGYIDVKEADQSVRIVARVP